MDRLESRKARRARAGTLEFRRAAHLPEVRSAGPSTLTLDGYACVTEQAYEMRDMFGSYSEVVRSGAFDKTLAEQADVRLLVNHEGLPLARTKSGTLVLDADDTGLHTVADLDSRQSLTSDVAIAMERGDLDQMSFAFRVVRQQWSPDYDQRDILEVELFDVSLVTYPANPATSAALRFAHVADRQMVVRARALAAELREGKVLSASNVTLLTRALEALHAADDALEDVDAALDDGQQAIADVLGVPDPDDDSDDEAKASKPGLSFATARAMADALALRI